MLEYTNNSLELLVLELLNQPLELSISISMFEFLWVVRLEGRQWSKENNVFTGFLFDTTIQDSGMRERSTKLINNLTL